MNTFVCMFLYEMKTHTIRKKIVVVVMKMAYMYILLFPNYYHITIATNTLSNPHVFYMQASGEYY